MLWHSGGGNDDKRQQQRECGGRTTHWQASFEVVGGAGVEADPILASSSALLASIEVGGKARSMEEVSRTAPDGEMLQARSFLPATSR